MSMDLNHLLNGQSDLHRRIANTVENLKKQGEQKSINIHAVETRIRLLDSLWEKFEEQHEKVRAGYKDDYAQSEYVTSNIFDITENTYVLQRSALAEYASRLKAPSIKISQSGDHGGEHAPKTALPRITLQKFSGAYEEWPSFRDLFLSVIGDNPSISNVERLHYLRSCLQGPAEKLIRPLAVIGENYDRAWAILSKHFENKRELIRSNFAAFTAVAKMKGDTAEELSRIHHAVTTAVNAQESIGRPINSHGMDLFNFLVIELFDSRTRLEWESATSDSSEPPNHDTLTNFINKRVLTLKAARPKSNVKASTDPSRTARTHFAKQDSAQCAMCKGKHILMVCPEFKAKSAGERRSYVETSRLCFNCLGNHSVAKCRSRTNCLTCNSRHHTMLHDTHVPPKPAEVSALSAVHRANNRKAVLLATARVSVADRHGDSHDVRVLIDQGSEVSIISESLMQRLRLPRSRSTVSIFGIGGAPSGATRGKVEVNLTSRTTGARLVVVAIILPSISLYEGPTVQVNTVWPHIKGLPLADPQYLDDDPIELLLGAEVCPIILENGLRKGGPQQPVAQNTILGWILSGGYGTTEPIGSRRSLCCTVDRELGELVHRFWEQEKEPSAPAALTPDEERCENTFALTHKRTAAGRFIVRLPFAKPPATLAETRKPAERLLSAMERKGRQDARFGDLYRSFMLEYEKLKHMEPVSTSVSSATPLCYLPHHGVFRESSATTKLRVVFNGSQRTRTDESLNNHLLVGANLLPALADVLLRWRWHRYALVSDIEKMYRQILVHPDDRDFQRVLWRHDASSNVREYRLCTVTYGLACAPFLAIRTLRQLANDEGSRYPRGSVALCRDCYVDDIVTGADTLSDAIAVQSELRELCTAGGFPLRKWAANNDDILEGVPPEHRLQRAPHEWENEVHSTLGLLWHPADDQFAFTIHPRTVTNFTKRRVLAETARLFDPLGWLAPIIIRAKILIQSAWLRRLDWDTPLPLRDALQWERFLAELPSLEGLRVNRWLGCGAGASDLQLHGFADASERGYAAAVYLRLTANDTASTHLLMAKSKVAPVKQVSLPRLELCAAALAASLVHHVREILSLFTAPVYLWSDSRVTLHWIQGHSSRWKTYVANRVSHIQLLLPEAQWRHVPGRDNPADCASRGIAPSDLLEHPLWWTGPAWLREDKDHWPNESLEIPDGELPERRAVTLAATRAIDTEPEMLLRFSSLHRLLRVTTWCVRWRRTASRTADRHPGDDALTLRPDEMDDSLFRWIRVVQALHYPTEFTAVNANRPVSPRSQLYKLTPFLDDSGVLRVGGRLKNAVLSHDERHPMILPPSSWLTQLLVESCHRRTLHGGVQLTLGLLRLRFWVPRGRATVKRLLHRCVRCTRWRAETPQPPMGNLPRGRVTPARPFLRTGVDYAGPIHIRTTRGRGHKAHKAFIAIFVCLCTKAVHIEAASDYSTDAFLAAFRRFISRRGLPEEMYSDCGTNFAGADRALRDLLHSSSSDGRRIAHAAATEGIKWNFNPPAAPHFGGLWEAAVKSTKHHLRRVIGETTLTFEEMSTFLAQVEACLNSRPLQALSDDADDVSALTPGHLLIGAPLLAVPEPPKLEMAESMMNRWKLIQRMRDHFWQRWSREYINAMHSRPKWLKPAASPDVGTLCLIRSEATPPSRWPLARITQLHPGDDGVVRVVTIRTAASEFRRPLVKLVMLPGAIDTHTQPHAA